MYQSQTPPLPPPHARYDYRYSSLSGVAPHQSSFVAGPPPDREYPEQFKKRKLSSDISVYSLSAPSGPGEEGSSRIDGYLRNTATPNISTPSSTERPSVELQPTRSRAQMSEHDKHELKKEKNREKQRRLRSRRAEQLNNLEHLNAEKDARLERLENEVKRLESEALQREDKWQRWVFELESRLAQARKRCQMLESASTGLREGDGQLDQSIMRELNDVRVHFGIPPRAGGGAERLTSYPTMRSADNNRVNDQMTGMFQANMTMPSIENSLPPTGSVVDMMSPSMGPPSVRRPSSHQDQYRSSASPLSIPARLSPTSRHPSSTQISRSVENGQDLESTLIAIRNEEKTGQMTFANAGNPAGRTSLYLEQGKVCRSQILDLADALPAVDPSIAAPYMKVFNTMNGSPAQPSPVNSASANVATAPRSDTTSVISSQRPVDPSSQTVDTMSESQILALDNTSLLQIAQSLIREKLPPSAYTPQQGAWNTTMEQERKIHALRTRNHSDASTLVDEDCSESPFRRPTWRDTFTPAEVHILYRALMFACSPSGSKDFFDGKRISELSPSQREVYERWAAYAGRDKRVSGFCVPVPDDD